MVKVLTVTSEYSPVPLAEIRTDGHKLEFIVDNTNGELPRITQLSYPVLLKVIETSSHLRVHEPTTATVSLLRYVLDNGDVVEVTNDGKTALVNGRLLSYQEKEALFAAIKNKELNVTRRADMANAVPVMPSEPKHREVPRSSPGIQPGDLQAMQTEQKKKKEKDSQNSARYDSDIEKTDPDNGAGLEPDFGKKLLYLLKYGTGKGGTKNA